MCGCVGVFMEEGELRQSVWIPPKLGTNKWRRKWEEGGQ